MASRRACQFALRRVPPVASAVGIAGDAINSLDWSVQRRGAGVTESMQADMNWFAVLAHHAARTPDQALTVFQGETITYAQMADRAAALAAGLAERGVSRGDVVALLSYNCPEFLETVFAANHLGAIAMPINWRLAAPEVRYILDHSGARALVCDEALFSLGREATKGLEATLVRACIAPSAGDGWVTLADLRTDAGRVEPVPA